jgi:hypothetical protein
MAGADPIVSPPDDFEPARLFYLAAEFRRAAIWGICGCLLIAVVGWTVGGLVNQRGVVDRIVIVTPLGGLAAWLSQYLFPRIRVDSMGINKRFLWWWDLWSWDAFSAGSFRLGIDRHNYHSPDRPWHRRTLHLGYLDQGDAQALDALIRRVWVPSPTAAIPDTLKFRFNWPDRRQVQLTAGGLTVYRKDRQTLYRWDEVLAVEIWRLESERRDFRELKLQLLDQECTLRMWPHQGQECRNWTGASAEVISACVSRYFTQPRFRDFSLHGTPRTLHELDARQSRYEATSKESLRAMIWCVRLFWGCVLVMFFLFPWPKSLFMVGMMGLLAWAVQWMYRDAARDVQLRRDEFEAERVAFTQQQE